MGPLPTQSDTLSDPQKTRCLTLASRLADFASMVQQLNYVLCVDLPLSVRVFYFIVSLCVVGEITGVFVDDRLGIVIAAWL